MKLAELPLAMLVVILMSSACDRPAESDTQASAKRPHAASSSEETREQKQPEPARTANLDEALMEAGRQQGYPQEELHLYAQILARPATEVRNELLDEGAVLDANYLIRYMKDERTAMAVRMIASGMDLNMPDQTGMRPLSAAALLGDMFLLELMLEQGADPLLQDEPPAGDGLTALHYAAVTDNAAITTRLLEAGIPVEQNSDKDITPLDMSARSVGADAMQVLIEHGADPGRMDVNGSIPILQAAKAGNLDGLKLLQSLGEDINFQHEKGWTPLLVSIHYNFPQLSNYLLDEGAAVDAVTGQGTGALAMAISVRDSALVGRLISAGAPMDCSGYVEGRNLIHMCALKRMPEFIELFVEEGVDPFAEDVNGYTPLDIAIKVGSAEAEEILREMGAVESVSNDSEEQV